MVGSRLCAPTLLLLSPAFAATLTFHKDIEPIFQARCQGCHRPGEVAPMPLLKYEDARPWAKAIRAAVITGKMPPWSPDPHYGKFLNDLSLAPGEKEKIVSWVDAGAPEGKPSDAPAPRQFQEGWNIPPPDVVFELPAPYDVPASGTIDYQYIRVPTNFTEDKWVQIAEVRPGAPAVVHHAIVVMRAPGSRRDEYLAGYAPGMTPQIWKPGEARLVKAGSVLEFQMHYATNGTPARDRTRIGLIFAKQPVTEQVIGTQLTPQSLNIPPGDANYRVDASGMMGQEVKLVAIRAHMHVRGKSMEVRAVYPTGETEILLNVPKYDFNWQPYYYLETPKVLPKGTRIEATSYFDNSPNNRFNPDPTATVTWGPQSWDEMMIAWLDIAVDRSAVHHEVAAPAVAPPATPSVREHD
ncbi:MAG TPA: cytochrome c [Bryobacteraceae bacterium]|nr:cytochrome c [Bryobacteraceae bacterium]